MRPNAVTFSKTFEVVSFCPCKSPRYLIDRIIPLHGCGRQQSTSRLHGFLFLHPRSSTFSFNQNKRQLYGFIVFAEPVSF